MPLLAEVRVTEDDLVRADRHRQIPDRRLTDLLAIDPDVGPRDRVQRDGPFGEFDLDRRYLAGRDLHGPGIAIPERLADDLEAVSACGHHQPFGITAAQQTAVLEQLN